ncbi:MAG: metallophosphoesterase family protein [Patescibacteria group bacterium]
MRIAIISDSHDNIPNIEKFLIWAKSNAIEMIIHCGDISAPTMISEVFVPQFSGPMHLVYGNVGDRDILPKICAKFPNVKYHGDLGELEIEGQKIAFCHFPETAKELAQSGKYNLVFYGHTHKPWMETLDNGCQLINPGTLGGIFQKACFAVYETKTKNLELKILETL